MPISFLKKYSYYITAILLISFAPYFIFYNHNFEQITFNQTIQPLMFLSLLVLFIFVILYFLLNIFSCSAPDKGGNNNSTHANCQQ